MCCQSPSVNENCYYYIWGCSFQLQLVRNEYFVCQKDIYTHGHFVLIYITWLWIFRMSPNSLRLIKTTIWLTSLKTELILHSVKKSSWERNLISQSQLLKYLKPPITLLNALALWSWLTTIQHSSTPMEW